MVEQGTHKPLDVSSNLTLATVALKMRENCYSKGEFFIGCCDPEIMIFRFLHIYSLLD